MENRGYFIYVIYETLYSGWRTAFIARESVEQLSDNQVMFSGNYRFTTKSPLKSGFSSSGV